MPNNQYINKQTNKPNPELQSKSSPI